MGAPAMPRLDSLPKLATMRSMLHQKKRRATRRAYACPGALLRRVVGRARSGGPRSPLMDVLQCGHKVRHWYGAGSLRRCHPCEKEAKRRA